MAASPRRAGLFLPASLAGNFAINWSGVNLVNGFEEDFVGVIPISSAASNNISNGVLDLTELGDGKIFTDVPVNGFLTLQGDGSLGGAQGNALQLTTTPSPATTYNFRAYLIDNNTIVIVGVDNERVVLGRRFANSSDSTQFVETCRPSEFLAGGVFWRDFRLCFLEEFSTRATSSGTSTLTESCSTSATRIFQPFSSQRSCSSCSIFSRVPAAGSDTRGGRRVEIRRVPDA